MLNRLLASMPTLFFVAALVAGCASVSPEKRIDTVPMYGQPEIPRPDSLKKADEDFVREAAAGLGTREKASHVWWLQAEDFLAKGDLDYAMRRYNQAWLLDPTSYRPYWGFARVMVERDRYDESIKFCEKAKQLIDDNYQKVALLTDCGGVYTAKASSTSAADTTGRSHFFNLANEQFKQAIALDATYGNAYRRWAISLYRQEQYGRAWEMVREARTHNASPFPESFLRRLQEKAPEQK